MKDINPHGDSSPYGFVVFNDLLFFSADDGQSGHELWKTDGTDAGTVRVKDILFGEYGSTPQELTVLGNAMYFSAGSEDDYPNDREIWRSDGTEAGTVRVKDIYVGGESSRPEDFTVFGDKVFFTADDGASGREPWISDGTELGTFRLKDITEGSDSSIASSAVAPLGNHLYFFASKDRFHGLWKSDGTPAGAALVRGVFDGEEFVGRR